MAFQLNNILKNNKIYLVCRGTKRKSGLIAENFNVRDKKITHVGLGFYTKDQLNIFNVSDHRPNGDSSLANESLETFIIDNTFYISIWECRNKMAEYEEAFKKCNDLLKNYVEFDYEFNLENNDKFYCSEFCCKILMAIKSGKFSYEAQTKILPKFYSMVLKREILEYFPVDFFQENKKFVKIFEKDF